MIGVAADARFRDLTTDLMDPGEDPDVYLPYAQFPTGGFEIVVRSATSAPASAEMVQSAVAALDPSVPLSRTRSLESLLAGQTAAARSGSAALGIFATLALALSGIGLYGVMAFLVVSRRRELAIRATVGADAGAVVRMVIRQGMALVGIGVLAGLATALLAGRLFSSLLFGVGAFDPAVFLSAATLALVGLAACAIPARRATRVDPVEALRHE